MEPITSFGYWLRRRRKALDLTQDALARQAGCALGTLKKIETDERRPSKQLAERLADCLAISAAERVVFLKAARAELATDQLAITPPLIEAIAAAARLPSGTVAEGLTLAQEVGHSPGVAWTRVWLGYLAVRQARYAAARVDLEESLALYRKQGYRRGAAWALLWLGKLAFHQGDYPSMRTLNEERLALEQTLGNKDGMAQALFCQALSALYQGQYVQATAFFETSLTLSQEVENQGYITQVLEGLGHVAMAQGAYVTADSHYKESLALCREINYQVGIACVIEGFADLAAAQAWPERAARLCGAGAALGADAFVFYDQRRQERIVATVRAQLDDATFAAAWAAGQQMTVEQAIAEALTGSATADGSSLDAKE